MRGIQVDLRVGKGDSAWESDSDLASALNSATGKRIRPTAEILWMNLVERRLRRVGEREGIREGVNFCFWWSGGRRGFHNFYY